MEIGGQAIIEGILIKSKEKVAISVRKKNKIKTKTQKTSSISKKFSKIPFLRGIVVLLDTIILGTRALIYSAKEQEEEQEKISNFALTLTITISFIIAIALFIFLPLVISKLITEERFTFNILDGVLRIVIFIGYIIIISKSKEVRRVFEYHGAEHMAVHCYESKKELTPKNCKKFSTIHPRCGTSFIFLVLIISIILFSIVWSENFFIKFLQRIILIPIIASLSYEILKFSSKRQKNPLIKLISIPGLLIQKITTKRPDTKQLEVAIAAVKEATSP
ncbi:MAG: DUF1385 domain-containing protein [Candidatus Woesearchaeota archaeon]